MALMRLVATALLVVTAGCLGGADDLTPASDESRGSGEVDGGLVADPSATADTQAEAADEPTSSPRVVPVNVEASTGTGAAACPPVRSHCLEAPSWPAYYEEITVEAANLTKLALNVTWTPRTPTTENLQVTVFGCLGDDWEDCEGLVGVEGPSPLVLEAAGGVFDRYAFEVSAPAASGTGAYAGADQPFVLEGILVVQP